MPQIKPSYLFLCASWGFFISAFCISAFCISATILIAWCYLLCSVAQLCLTLCNPVDCSPPGFSVHGISQARTLEWPAISFSRGSCQPRDWTCVSCIGRQALYHQATWGAPQCLLLTVMNDLWFLEMLPSDFVPQIFPQWALWGHSWPHWRLLQSHALYCSTFISTKASDCLKHFPKVRTSSRWITCFYLSCLWKIHSWVDVSLQKEMMRYKPIWKREGVIMKNPYKTVDNWAWYVF